MKYITVVAAIIVHDNKILCVQRGPNKFDYISYKWEFPGGKTEDGESNEQTIIREIDEELGLQIVIEKKFITVDHQYNDFSLIMYSFICSCNELDIQLREHVDFKWLSINKLQTLDWAAADIPIVTALIQEYATK
jgi:8-oxo-dGTP diphosphatase